MIQIWQVTPESPVYAEPGMAKRTILKELTISHVGSGPYMIDIREATPCKNVILRMRCSGIGISKIILEATVFVPIRVKLFRIGRPTPRDVPPAVTVTFDW